ALRTTRTVYVLGAVAVGVVDSLTRPPPQPAKIPAQATIMPSHIMVPRRRRGERSPINTIAGTMPIHDASIQGELGCSRAAVIVRVIVSVAVVVVPTAPNVIVGGVNEHARPGGRLAQESTSVRPAVAAFGVNETVNVADCPAGKEALCGEVEMLPAFPSPAMFNPLPEIAKPNTDPLGVPELNFASCLPEAISKR